MADQDPVAAAVEAILRENQRARADLLAAIDALPPEHRDERWFGEWSVRDVLAHLYAWQDGFAHALERLAAGERPEIPDFDPRAEDGEDQFNAQAVEANRHLSWEELLAHLRAARERHEAAVRGLVGNIDAERYEEGRTARRLSDSGTHDREHMTSILAWRREQGI